MNQYDNQADLLLETGPTVRPLQGLHANKRGSSWRMQLGDSRRTLFESRTDSNDAEMLTVTVGAVPIENPLAIMKARDLFATITWGVGGASYSCDIDLIYGMTFSLMASYLRVDATYNGIAPDVGGPTVFQVSGGVGYGTYTNPNSSTRRTFLLADIAASGTAVVLIPPFATSFTVCKGERTTTLDIDVLSLTAPIQQYSYTDVSNNGNQNEQLFPLNNGAIAVEVTNAGADPINAVVIFNLSV